MQNKLQKIFDRGTLEQKILISLFYRVILISYSFFLYYKNDIGIKYYWCIFVTAVYLFLLYLLIRPSSFKNHLRLILDYSFIGFFIFFGKDLDIYSIIFLLAPIANSVNSINKISPLLLHLYPLIIIFIAEKKFNWWYIVPFTFFYIINSFFVIKEKHQRIYNTLDNLIDDFFVENKDYDQSFRIYESIREIFNNENLIKSKKTDEIFCFEKVNNELIPLDGSFFIGNHSFELENELIQIKPETIKKWQNNIVVNDKSFNNSMIYITKINDATFYYFFMLKDIFSGDESDFSVGSNFHQLLFPFFKRLSKFHKSFQLQQKNNISNYELISEKITYVNNALSSMHFTRNKLTPLKSYLAMVKDFENSDKEKKEKILPFLKKEREKLNSSINEILTRADLILEKSNNPFNVTQNIPHSPIKLYFLLKRVWNYYLPSNKNIDVSFSDFDILNNKILKFNELGIELVFVNWISNMLKYKKDDLCGIKFKESSDYYRILFFNRITITNGETPEFVKLFNSDDRMAILRRNTHGLIEIKDFLDQMNINYEMGCKDDILSLEIEIEKHL